MPTNQQLNEMSLLLNMGSFCALGPKEAATVMELCIEANKANALLALANSPLTFAR